MNHKNRSHNKEDEGTTEDQSLNNSIIDMRKQNWIKNNENQLNYTNSSKNMKNYTIKSDVLTLESLTSSEIHENNINIIDSGFVSMRNELEKFNINVKQSNN
jgi:hypothetical protein